MVCAAVFRGAVHRPLLFAVRSAPHRYGQPSSADRMQHWLGTDHLGRDIFSRMVAGAKATVGTALGAILIFVFIGVPVGLVSGFFGGRLDRMMMRIVDAVMAFPDYIVAIVLSGLLHPG